MRFFKLEFKIISFTITLDLFSIYNKWIRVEGVVKNKITKTAKVLTNIPL